MKKDIGKLIRENRKVFYLMLAFVLIGISVFTRVTVHYILKKDVEISDVFLSSEVAPVQGSLEMAGQYITKDLTEEQKKEVLSQIADSIGLSMGDNDLYYSLHDEVTEVSVMRKAKAADTDIKLVSVNVNKQGEIPVIQNYVMVNMQLYDKIASVMNYKSRIEKAFDRLEINNGSSYVQFTGDVPGQLSLDGKNKLTNQMIKELDGRVTYESREDGMYTVYAYSGGIQDYINVGGGKVNLQVAMSYDETKNQTTVYLASPIMNGSY